MALCKGKPERRREFAAELVQTRRWTSSSLRAGAPICQGSNDDNPDSHGCRIADPVGSGIVASLARPGGNITGLAALAPEISGKQLELLKEIIPRLIPRGHAREFDETGRRTSVKKETELAARVLGCTTSILEVQSPKDIETDSEPQQGACRRSPMLLNPILNLQRHKLSNSPQRIGCRQYTTGRICGCGRTHVVRTEHYRRRLSARRDLCGQDFQGRQACRSASGAAEEVSNWLSISKPRSRSD